jgi:AraC family transcriptional regulator
MFLFSPTAHLKLDTFEADGMQTKTVDTDSCVLVSPSDVDGKIVFIREVETAYAVYIDNTVQAVPALLITDDKLLQIILCLLIEASASAPVPKLYTHALTIALSIHIESKYAYGRSVFAPKGKLSSKQLIDVLELIRHTTNKNIRLSELASSVHLSEYHFARLFRQTIGVSPYRFVLEMKIEHAKNLIKKEKRSFGDIAYILNFSDQAHFSHAFKKITGFSPRKFVALNAAA